MVVLIIYSIINYVKCEPCQMCKLALELFLVRFCMVFLTSLLMWYSSHLQGKQFTSAHFHFINCHPIVVDQVVLSCICKESVKT